VAPKMVDKPASTPDSATAAPSTATAELALRTAEPAARAPSAAAAVVALLLPLLLILFLQTISAVLVQVPRALQAAAAPSMAGVVLVLNTARLVASQPSGNAHRDSLMSSMAVMVLTS